MNEGNKPIQADVIILGAGLAGLAAAQGVLNHGEVPLVLEKEEIAGGMCASIRKNGFIFDLGGHRFLPHNKETTDYARSLFADGELLLRPRKSQIYLNKKFLFYPPEAFDILKNLGVWVSLNCMVQGLYARLRQAIRKSAEVTLRDWLVNRFGRKLYDIYFGPYSAKLWGLDPSHISADWAPQRVSVASIGVVIQKLLAQKGKSAKTYARQFLYPVGGIGRMPENMAQQIKKNGGDVLLGFKVCRLARNGSGFTVEAQDIQGRKKTFSAAKVISTIPLPELVSIFSPAVGRDILEAAGYLQFRSVRFLNLLLDIPEVTKNTWLYVPEEKFIFFRIQEFTKWCPSNAPRGKVPLTLEVACQKGDDVWEMPDEELLHTCLRDLKKMDIDLKNKVLGYFSSYAEHAYPFYSIGYKRHLQKVYHFIESIDNLVISGRQGLFRYINMDIAIENGFQAAASLYDFKKRIHYLREKEDSTYLEANLYLKKK